MPIRYKITKHKINIDTWLVLWTGQTGETFAEYFYNEAEADNFITGN